MSINDLFGTSVSSMFGDSNSSFGDYSMIQSGAYKKLLKSYYSEMKGTDSIGSSDRSEKNYRYSIKSSSDLDAEKTGKNLEKKEPAFVSAGVSDDATTLATIAANSKALSSSASALVSKSLYATEDSKGNKVDAVKNVRNALQSYVDAYNSYMATGRKTYNTAIQNKNLDMFKENAENAQALKDLGITTDRDGKLVFDETKITSSNLSDVQEMFQKKGSYGEAMNKLATGVNNIATSNTYNSGSGSSYSTSGAYSVLGTTSTSTDQYL